MKRCLAFTCVLPFAALIVPSASLVGPVDPGVKLVRYSDLDLSTVGGMKTLHRRIEAALDEVCLDPNGPGPVGTVNYACKRAGRRDAIAQVESAAARQIASRAMSGTGHAVAVAMPRPDHAPNR